MKRIISSRHWTYLTATLYLLLASVIAFAQDGSVSTTTKTVETSTTESFVIQPWMWVVGGAVLLIILIALLRGGSSSTTREKVVITKED